MKPINTVNLEFFSLLTDNQFRQSQRKTLFDIT